MVSLFFVAAFNAKASFPPPITAPEIAPHLKPSLLAISTALMASFMSPVSIPRTIPAVTPPNAAEETAINAPVFALAAKIIETAGAPSPAVTYDTVTHTSITPAPIATFFRATPHN